MTDNQRGVCFFAYNNEQIDYIRLAMLASKYVKRHLGVPVTVITDSGTMKWADQSLTEYNLSEYFDNIVITTDEMKQNVRRHYDSPWSTFDAQFSNSNKHKVWEYSPYEQTLLLDIDYIVRNNYLNHVWDNYTGVGMFRDARNIRNEPPAARETWLFDAGIKMWWSTVIYFDRSESSELFFNTWAHVADNYEFYRYLYNFPGKLFRTDYCVSIATHILNGMVEDDVVNQLPTNMYFLDQKDDIIEVRTDEWICLSNDREEVWKNILVNYGAIDLHVMNKRALDRHWQTLWEKADG